MTRFEKDLIKTFKYNPETGAIFRTHFKKYLCGEVKTKDSYGYIIISRKHKQYKGHRVAWFLHFGSWPKNHIDHINGDITDNSILNLREATYRQNASNRIVHRKGKLIGASWEPKRNKWMSRIYYNKKYYYLGDFKTEIEAHNAYKTKLTELTSS